MKKILFAALAAAFLATGCQKTEIINRVGDSIGFSTELGKITKASDANAEGMDNLKAQDFYVWAYNVADDPNTAVNDENQPYDNIIGIKIEDEGENWITNEGEYYWPGKGKALKFFAVSGVQSKDAFVPVATSNTASITGFIVDPSNPNTDLMVADFVQQTQEDSKKVMMNFRHALSKVQFLFHTTSTTENVFVQNIVIKELNNTGDLDMTVTGSDFNDKFQKEVTLTFKNQSGSVNYTASGSTKPDGYPEKYFDVDGTEVTSGGNETAMKLSAKNQAGEAAVFSTWLMIPQTISEKEVEITYLINNRQFKSIFALDNDGKLEKWAENQYIKYIVELSPNKITFDANVEDWTKPSTDVDMVN